MKRGKIAKSIKKIPFAIFLYVLAGLACFPIVLIVTGSIMGNLELERHLHAISADTNLYISWKLIPDYPTIKHYVKLLFYMPDFYVVFGNSIKLVGCILLGQLLIALPGSWAFATYSFRYRNALFSLYIVLMLMPFQVTMLSNYLVLDALHIMNTHKAIILPAVFSTFPVFLMYRGFCSIPVGMLDAARIDGAGEFKTFLYIGLPMGSTGVLSAMVLGFLEYWSLIEQPLAFLKDKSRWPLSLFLPEIGIRQAGYVFVASVITLIPAVFVFILGQDYLEQGIIASAMKE